MLCARAAGGVSPGLFRVIETGSASIGRKISPNTNLFVDPYIDG
jgi:hypothetical protein